MASRPSVNGAEIATRLHGRKSGAGWVAKCPAHEDHEPSLSLKDADGKVLVKCFAGCDQRAVIAALRERGLWPEREERIEKRIVATYDYRNADGDLLYQVVRTDPKNFYQRVPNGAGGWLNRGPKNEEKVLYRLREVLDAPIIFLPEGEKDVEALRGFGFVATTNAGGASAPWLPQYTETLRGREVILCCDRDEPGRERGRRIARALFGHVSRLVVFMPDNEKDIAEWLEKGHSECELIAMVEKGLAPA